MTIYLNDLRDQVILQRCVLKKDSYGGYENTWQNMARLWVKLTPLSSYKGHAPQDTRGQRMLGLEEYAHVYKVVARAQYPIKTGMRLYQKGRVLGILQTPLKQGNYQFFEVSTSLKSDGGFHD